MFPSITFTAVTGEQAYGKLKTTKQTMNPAIIKIILAIVQALAAALAASRNDPEKVAAIKADADKQFDELEGLLKDGEDHKAQRQEICELRSTLEDTVTFALAARAPTPEQIAEVEKISPAGPKEEEKKENVVQHKSE